VNKMAKLIDRFGTQSPGHTMYLPPRSVIQTGKSLLCLDIGFSNMGYSVFQHNKLWSQGLLWTEKSPKKNTRVSDDYASRCAHLALQLKSLCNSLRLVGICAELPSGTQNARAASQMSMALAIVASSAMFLNLPTEYYTAQEVKVAATGNKKATKEEIKLAMGLMFGFERTTKEISIQKGKRKGKITIQETYRMGKLHYNGGDFEHIADSIGVFLAAGHNNLVRLMGGV